ncbi:MAG: nuclear transport factor 2 family protein [Gemmatimonadaceae bacterium]
MRWRVLHRTLWLVSVPVAGIAAGACVAQAQAASRVKAQVTAATREIRAARERSNRAIAEHDVEDIVREMMPDVHVVTSAGTQLAGVEANRASFAERFQAKPDVSFRRTPDIVAVYMAWGMASELGRWVGTWTDPDGKIRISGSYFAKWQKSGTTWRIQSETYVPLHCEGGAYCRERPLGVPGPDSASARR